MHVGPLHTKGRCKKPPTFKRIENTDWWISLIATGRFSGLAVPLLKLMIMKTTLLLQQHHKCQCILEMIAKVEQFLFTKKRSFDVFMSYPPNERSWRYLFSNEDDFRNAIARYEGIKNRLEKYYWNNMHKIVITEQLEQ